MKHLIFEYKNWKGIIGIRKVIPIKIWYGEVEYHEGEQWLLEAYDSEDNDKIKNFAVKDILCFYDKTS
jgi:hypothetical protein